MATKHPRLNVVLEPSLYFTVQQLARKDRVSLSLKARDLIRQALEYCEDLHWLEAAERREETFHKKTALSHKKIWPQ